MAILLIERGWVDKLTGNFQIPEIPDAEWERMSVEDQRRYNYKIDLKNEYNEAKEQYDTSMSVTGPGVLILMGFIGLIFGGPIGIVIIIIAVVWLFLRFSSRAQAYMRFKDAKAALIDVIAPEK